jgi:pimeloyl-ACP methyl ester carboxylesterase
MIGYVKYNNTRVKFSDSGRGRLIVLLHGYLETGEVWMPLEEKLREGFRVVSVDLPGHGESDVAGETHTMEFLAEVTREVFKYTGESKALLVGHSLGGYVALAFAEKYPRMLSGYVLFHSHPYPDSPEAIEKRKREISVVMAGKKDLMYPANISMMFAESNLKLMDEELSRSKKLASQNPAEGIIAMLNGMIVRPSRVSVVESGKVPLLWILGRHDLYFTPEKALGTVKIPVNARVVVLENSGHLGFIEETGTAAKMITGFAVEITWDEQE